MAHELKEYPYKLMHKYPGMRPQDVIIWDEFVKRNPQAFQRVWYDVHMGDPLTDAPLHGGGQETGAKDVSQWCVDVIGDTGRQFWVIEVKPSAMANALGQALAYRGILVSEHRVPRESIAVVLTDELIPITEQAAKLLGVMLIVP